MPRCAVYYHVCVKGQETSLLWGCGRLCGRGLGEGITAFVTSQRADVRLWHTLPQEGSETKEAKNGIVSLISEFKGRLKTKCCWGIVVEEEFGIKWDL